MKYVHLCALLIIFAMGSPAVAQWQVPKQGVPIGRGSAAIGFDSAVPGPAGMPLGSNGPSSKPSFRLAGPNGGGTGADNSTNSAGDLLASNSLNGTFVHTALNVVCGIVPLVCARVVGYVSIAWYGALCNGFTDDTTAIQNAWNAAASLLVNAWLGGAGPACKISSLTAPAPVPIPGGFGEATASVLKGPGGNQVELLSTVSGSTCAITMNVAFGTSVVSAFEGFGLRQIADAQIGAGFCLNGLAKMTFQDVRVASFFTGFEVKDSILLNFNRVWVTANVVGIRGTYVANTPPNGWNITTSHFSGQVSYSIFLSGLGYTGGPSANMISGNDFESNGTISGLSTIYQQCEVSQYGGVGLNVISNYFEGNGGTEVTIDQCGQPNRSGVHNIMYNGFTRSLSALTAGVVIANSAASTHTTVNAVGNGFTDVLLTGASFQWLSVTAPGTFNSTFVCSGNTANVPAEVNSRCGTVGVSKTMSSDANAQWAGFN